MLRAMYSGISGMKVNQVKLDVTGNNISNVGTTAFKGARTRFQDALSQNVTSALAPSLYQGGVNPSKVGLGVRLAGIDTLTSQGTMQPTSRNLDMAVDGEGYFMVSKGPVAFEDDLININDDKTIGDTGNNDIFFTRDGAFTLDSEGNLLNSNGLRVLGYAVTGNGMPDADGEAEEGISSIGETGEVNFVDADSADDEDNLILAASTDLRTLKIPDKVLVSGTAGGADAVYKRIISFTVESDGLIKAVCDGGKVAVLGQIAMSSFKNPGGLEKVGNNLYRNSPNSGEAVIRTGIYPKTEEDVVDNAKGYGDIMQGMLEMSNVDLSEQFTDLIVTTRAFQASGKMITTGDEILQEIINLKR